MYKSTRVCIIDERSTAVRLNSLRMLVYSVLDVCAPTRHIPHNTARLRVSARQRAQLYCTPSRFAGDGNGGDASQAALSDTGATGGCTNNTTHTNSDETRAVTNRTWL
jgi:hypothetical protein